jgi:hypothetical protein
MGSNTDSSGHIRFAQCSQPALPLALRRDLLEMRDDGCGVSPVPPLPQPPSGVLREAKTLACPFENIELLWFQKLLAAIYLMHFASRR